MARRQVSIYINSEGAAGSIKELQREMKGLTKTINDAEQGSEEYLKAVGRYKELNGILDEHKRGLRGIQQTHDGILKGGLAKIGALAAGAFAADTIISYGKELFRLGSEMELMAKKAETVFGVALPAVSREADRNATAMGLTTQAYIAQAAAIGDLLIPMGFQREEAARISTQLVNLSGALSEWSGGTKSAQEASNALSSALLGEREELKQFGIAISEADVKAKLAEKGLEKLTGKMLEQAKAAATLELVLEKSTDAQNAFALNSETAVRRQAELNAKLADVAEKLSTALLPVFERLVGFADDVADGLTNITDSLTGFLDPAKQAAEAFADQNAKVSQLETELVPLLDRYDELKGKSKLSAAEQEELAKVIARIGEITPSAITQVDEYGRVLGINADAAREFIEVEKARLEVVRADDIAQRQKEIETLKKQQAELKKLVETGKELRSLGSGGVGGGAVISEVNITDQERTAAREKLAAVTRKLIGTEAELGRLRGDNLKIPETGGDANKAADQAAEEEKLKAAAAAEARKEAAEKAAKEREKEKEREEKELMQKLERLQEITLEWADKERLARLSVDERAIEEIKLKYKEQIDLAKELEAKGVKEATALRLQLEQQKLDEILRTEQELHTKKLEERQRQLEEEIEQEVDAEIDKALRREEARKQIQEFINEAGLTERELAIAELEKQYEDMAALAAEFGLDVTEITKAYREKLAKVNADFDKKDLEKQRKSQAERAAAVGEAFGAIGNAVGSLIDLVGNKTKEAADLSRGLAIFQIATKTAEAIANGVAAASDIPFPGNLAAIATTVGTVLGNIANAKRILSEESKVPQRATGGFYDVTGQDDGRPYHAQYIGRPDTGLLPGRPVLLASEKGPEYFVANKDLRNPRVLDYVRAIENIRRARLGGSVRQYADGGFSDASEPALSGSTVAGGVASDTGLSPAVEELTGFLRILVEEGVRTVLTDDMLVDIQKRYRKLSAASGGVL